MRKRDYESVLLPGQRLSSDLIAAIDACDTARQERDDARAQLAAVREDLEGVRKVRDEAIKARDDSRAYANRICRNLVAVRRERDEARAKLAKLLERMSTAVAELDAPDPDDAPAKPRCLCAFCNPALAGAEADPA